MRIERLFFISFFKCETAIYLKMVAPKIRTFFIGGQLCLIESILCWTRKYIWSNSQEEASFIVRCTTHSLRERETRILHSASPRSRVLR